MKEQKNDLYRAAGRAAAVLVSKFNEKKDFDFIKCCNKTCNL